MEENVKKNIEVGSKVVSDTRTTNDKKEYNKSNSNDRHNRRNSRNRRDNRKANDGFDNRLVQVNRVTKVVKGGKNMSFTALVVVGDKKGLVGVASGKANEVPNAIEKATSNAKKHLSKVAMSGTTIPHQVIGYFGKSKVLLMPAPEGTGVIAGSSVRAVMELAGYRDVVSKSFGSRNKINTVKATIEALKLLRDKNYISSLRGKNPEEI